LSEWAISMKKTNILYIRGLSRKLPKEDWHTKLNRKELGTIHSKVQTQIYDWKWTKHAYHYQKFNKSFKSRDKLLSGLYWNEEETSFQLLLFLDMIAFNFFKPSIWKRTSFKISQIYPSNLSIHLSMVLFWSFIWSVSYPIKRIR
jgi:hypothetical protein